MLSTIIHYEVILNIILTILVVCLATYTLTQDMRLRKYKLLLAAKQSGGAHKHNQQGKPALLHNRLAA